MSGEIKRKPGRPKKALVEKRKPGRPRLDDARKHAHIVLLNDEEEQYLQYTSEKRGWSTGRIFRDNLLKIYRDTKWRYEKYADENGYYDEDYYGRWD